MTRKEQNKILNDKIESNVNQYKVDRLNAEISAFSSGDLNKYEFLKRIDLNYKPNALDKARFEFSPLGKTFSTGLDKTAQCYQEEGITKLLKYIRDSLAGNVIIPARPLRPNDNGNDDNGNDDYGNDDNGNDDNKIAETDSIDLSWMNDLQLHKKIASEVFSRYNGDKDSFELFTLRTFIDNINNEQAIFGDDENDEDLLEAEELDRRFKNLISKKRRESLREYLKESEDDNPQDRVNALKEYLKKAKYTDLQIKVNASKKKLNNLSKTISDDNNNNNDNDDSEDNNNNNDNDDSEDNQISNFVDEVLKKVSKEIVNDDNKKVSKEIVNDDAKKKSNQKSKENITERIKKMEASENLFNKQFRDVKEILELDKNYKESSAKTDKMIKELSAKIKDRDKASKNTDKVLKKYYTKEAQKASEEIEKYNKMINDNLDMSSEKSEIIN